MRSILWMTVLVAWMAPSMVWAQSPDALSIQPAFEKTGKVWFHWGYNRSAYNDSDIHFKGDGYDFTLHGARAHDMPEEWDAKVYLNPTKLTIPQFNFRVGYWLNERISLSIGWDHMKYRLANDQPLIISGTIEESASAIYAGEYDQYRRHNMTYDFLRYEHSDGFNFVRIGAEYSQPVWIGSKGRVQASLLAGAYTGLMLPWTDTRIFGTRHRNWIHLAGYGLSTTAGWRIDFLNHFFVMGRMQWGWTHLMDVLIAGDSDARAEQKIVFMERALVAGATFRLWKN